MVHSVIKKVLMQIIIFIRDINATENGNYKEAINYFTIFLELLPNSTSGIYTIADSVYDKLNDYSKAISDFTKAIEINPNNADAYFNRELLIVN